jgi:hypothetical protein
MHDSNAINVIYFFSVSAISHFTILLLLLLLLLLNPTLKARASVFRNTLKTT